MTTLLKDFVNSHPTVALSNANYGRHFHLGHGVNIPSSPTQRLHMFVETEGTPYRFIVVGCLMSFKVVEDSVRRPWFKFINFETASILHYCVLSLDIIFQSTLVNLKHRHRSQMSFLASYTHYKI
jgi:hypothetical protein